jgi:hypothetical protein
MKFIAEEHIRLDSDDAFWAKYSNPEGVRLGYQQILDSLKQQRHTDSKYHAKSARTYFGGDLGCADTGGAFGYIKNSVPEVSSKDDSIAKKWKALLAEDPAVAQKWGEMQTLHEA